MDEELAEKTEVQECKGESDYSCCESDANNMAECCPTSDQRDTHGSDSWHWISDYMDTPAGNIPVVEISLQFKDHLGSWKARWGINRMSYSVKPGLYAAGTPDSQSPVFVSANYKMSFDVLRSNLKDIPSWILVLDTKGINVWCAAGKGTFGTDEIVKRIEETGLSKVVSHKTIIVPQLGASGVSAHKVRQQSGYKVVYGPVRASDIPQFMDNNLKATPEMREVKFRFFDRLVLTPIEIRHWADRMFFGKRVFIIPLFFLLGGIDRSGFSADKALHSGTYNSIMYFLAFLCGALFTPLLLPWLPGRAFSIKGAFLGFLLALGTGWYRWDAAVALGIRMNILAWLFLVSAISSFIAVTFLGSSTYTSLSGVFKEMKRAVPFQVAAMIIGTALLVAGQFV